ncbi:MAG: 4Fe-4S dicluster domain-containing protein [Candidatus Aenigmarchaeota archaeon]|nr:4Fe-4S dicluster domain-containing protein [Candidatus Aenigmarchaeota archaeon]
MMKLAKEAIKNMLSPPATRKYPKIKPKLPENFRGKIEHFPEKCTYCGLCEKNCPSNAITVDREKKTWACDYGKCTFCSQCEEDCRKINKCAIKLTKDYELAKKNKNFKV